MIYKIMIILVFGFSIQVSAQNSNKFSDKINLKKFIKEYIEIDKYRADTELSEVNIQNIVEESVAKYCIDININDTIFILETRILETRIYYGSLWNDHKRIDFVIPYKKRLKFSNHKAFTEQERLAISKWNKNVICSLNEEGKRWINPDWHYATRIIIGNGNIYVERESYLN